MWSLPPSVRSDMAVEGVDLRRGHDGLAAIVRAQWGLDVFAGHLFVFLGRRRDRCKILFAERGGLVLYYKRLEAGRFRAPRVAADGRTVEIDSTELAMLLDGIDVAGADNHTLHRPARRCPSRTRLHRRVVGRSWRKEVDMQRKDIDPMAAIKARIAERKAEIAARQALGPQVPPKKAQRRNDSTGSPARFKSLNDIDHAAATERLANAQYIGVMAVQGGAQAFKTKISSGEYYVKKLFHQDGDRHLTVSGRGLPNALHVYVSDPFAARWTVTAVTLSQGDRDRGRNY